VIATGLVNDVVYGQLSIRRTKTVILGQILFLALALLLPMITHRLGLNFRIAQPMHWMILFAGLTYGPISGLLMGISVPVASFLISGMPLPVMLPLMIPELAVYGLVAGLLKRRVTSFGSLAIALIAGRAVFLIALALTGGLDGPIFERIQRTWWSPSEGVGFVMLFQIVLLPFLSGLYVNWAKD